MQPCLIICTVLIAIDCGALRIDQKALPEKIVGKPVRVYTGYKCSTGITPYNSVQDVVADWFTLFYNPLRDCVLEQSQLVGTLKKQCKNRQFKDTLIDVIKTVEFCIVSVRDSMYKKCSNNYQYFFLKYSVD